MTTIFAVISDLHSNSSVALCPPTGIQLDDGGMYRPSYLQRSIWNAYIDFWGQVARLRTEHAATRLVVLLNGDLMEGKHHGTVQLITENILTQNRIVIDNLEPMLALNPDDIFVVRGTQTHVGSSAQWEEFVGQDIGAVQEPITKAYSWWWLPLEIEGVKFDIAHHGRSGGRPWTKHNAVLALAAQLVMEYAEQKGKWKPDVAIRSHVHTGGDSYDAFSIRVIQTYSWQGQTSFGQRIGAGQPLPIGGMVFICNDGQYEVEKFKYEPARVKPWKLKPLQNN